MDGWRECMKYDWEFMEDISDGCPRDTVSDDIKKPDISDDGVAKQQGGWGEKGTRD